MERNQLSCDHCGETFQRREHRDRHVLRHTGLKPFQCNICSKSFSRSDTLARHRVLHGNQPGSTRTRRRRRGQACYSCSRSKQSCDGGHPCSRCETRNSECIYPERALSARRDDGEAIIVGEPSQGEDIATLSPLAAQGADFQDEAFIPGDLHGTSEEWNNPSSIPSDTSGMPTIASSTMYTTVPDTSSWPNVPTLPDTFVLNGDFGSLGTITGNSWMPWNSSMAQLSFPWFMDELELPLDPPNMSQPHEDAVHATSIQAGQAYLSPENICSSHTQPCHQFPEPEAIGLQMAGAEVFGHIHEIPQDAVEGLNTFYNTQRRDPTPVPIPQDILHAFVELYFEYFDCQFPFLHPSRMEDPDLPWILLLAVAAVGSHYSEIKGADEYNSALSNLLARAVELPAYDNMLNAEVITVQCVFLLHVLWLFSGSHRDKIVLQHKRSSLATMCCDLISKADKRRHSSRDKLNDEVAWQNWIAKESVLRLVTCARVLECLSHIFLGTPLVFNLREATRQLPCTEKLWRCQNASEWKSRHEDCPGIANITARHQRKPDTFAAKVILLELYVEDRNYYRQLRTSQLLHSSFESYLNSSASRDTQQAPNHSLPRPDLSRSENALLDTTIDGFTLKNMPSLGDLTDTVFHVIAILNLIPLETLHSATGWETNKEQMKKSKTHLNDFFKNNDTTARKGLWHAVCIFKITRSSRRLACYDALSLTVAMGYIYCYSETRTSLAPTSARPLITRLDRLQDREAIERWIENGGDNVVHLTGVGLLDGSDHCVRFLLDLERTLVSQIAWRGFCRAFASSFAQLRRGETPTKSSREYNNDE
ncbi:hypothetical protein FVEG_17474 [Fusarium verticillioides 7600]|uniref:Zinc finger protein ADR1 n=1 Tax=Gibberella moniliformis (strain M3125 / FGSC 7600) TaxID=334819 RepID=W7NG13_GIBM7|nr:hypothetical protein FVEG_17474 [Fusarium verticillioides 7600]EWG55217.1 hypothetical protein FVEG_17474 [Fusarium verticillioides 7600]